jgi:GH25 family lysozyme M1 (1,4-beta-N-acetylmuramidase)
MLKGIDISHHNKYQYNMGQIDFNKHDFIIMKATEGKTFVDPMMGEYMKKIIAYEKPYGFYHFARPEKNTAIEEAKHFCSTIDTDGVGAMLVLDWEATALRYPIEWALEWLRYVEKEFNKKPLIYCSSWYTKKLAPVLANGNGLWVAHYTKAKKPIVHTYPFYALWQYTSDPYDKDVFNGNIEEWHKYC